MNVDMDGNGGVDCHNDGGSGNEKRRRGYRSSLRGRSPLGDYLVSICLGETSRVRLCSFDHLVRDFVQCAERRRGTLFVQSAGKHRYWLGSRGYEPHK